MHVLTVAPAPTTRESAAPTRPATTLIAGGGMVPDPLLAKLTARDATTRPIAPADTLTAEPGQRPQATLNRFVRARDLTCSFPGCDHPAQRWDLDQTVAHATSALTHPAS